MIRLTLDITEIFGKQKQNAKQSVPAHFITRTCPLLIQFFSSTLCSLFCKLLQTSYFAMYCNTTYCTSYVTTDICAILRRCRVQFQSWYSRIGVGTESSNPSWTVPGAITQCQTHEQEQFSATRLIDNACFYLVFLHILSYPFFQRTFYEVNMNNYEQRFPMISYCSLLPGVFSDTRTLCIFLRENPFSIF